MKDFFYAIEDLFVNYLFKPFDGLRNWAYDSWWLSNIVSWILLITGIIAFVYWMKKLNDFDEDTDAHQTVY